MTRPNILFVCSKNQWRSPTAEAISNFNALKPASTVPRRKKTKEVESVFSEHAQALDSCLQRPTEIQPGIVDIAFPVF